LSRADEVQGNPAPRQEDLIVKTRNATAAGGQIACAAVLLSLLELAIIPAMAAPAAPKAAKPAAVTATVVPDPEVTSSIEEPDLGPACERPRRRLWVEGEGWVIRRVTVCH
jgi:hypothetical protein